MLSSSEHWKHVSLQICPGIKIFRRQLSLFIPGECDLFYPLRMIPTSTRRFLLTETLLKQICITGVEVTLSLFRFTASPFQHR